MARSTSRSELGTDLRNAVLVERFVNTLQVIPCGMDPWPTETVVVKRCPTRQDGESNLSWTYETLY